MSQALALPAPISLNNAFANAAKGRRKTPEYRAWCRQAAQMLGLQRIRHVEPPVEITYHVGADGVGGMDGDNVIKAYADAMVEAGVLPDDNRRIVPVFHLVWVPGLKGCVAVIAPYAAPNVDMAASCRGALLPEARGLLP